jgi:hypothetical protein
MKRSDALLDSLAMAEASGVKYTAWAKAHGVSARAAYGWRKLPEYRQRIGAHRAEVLDRVLELYHSKALNAVLVVGRLMETAKNEAVQLAAARGLISDLMSVQTFGELKAQIQFLQQEISEIKRGNPGA